MGPSFDNNLNISLVNPNDIDQEFDREWCDLGRCSFRKNPFFEPWFLKPALELFDQDRNVQFCIARCKDTDQMIAFLPIVASRGYRNLPIKYFHTWTHSQCFNGMPIIRKSFERLFYHALMGWVNQRPEGAQFLQLLAHPFDQSVKDVLVGENGEQRYIVQQHFQRAQITQKNKFSDYINEQFSPKRRSELRRTFKRLSELGRVELGRVELTDAIFNSYTALELSGWKNPYNRGLGNDEVLRQRKFFRTAMLNGYLAGAVSCYCLALDGVPVAISFQLKSGGYLGGFKTVYDEKYASYSPGIHVLMKVLEDMLNDPSIRQFDSCAAENHPVMNRLMKDRQSIAQLNLPSQSGLVRSVLSSVQVGAEALAFCKDKISGVGDVAGISRGNGYRHW